MGDGIVVQEVMEKNCILGESPALVTWENANLLNDRRMGCVCEPQSSNFTNSQWTMMKMEALIMNNGRKT